MLSDRSRTLLKRFLAVFLLLAVVLLAWILRQKGGGDRSVVVYTSVDQVFSAPVFRRFEEETRIRVRAVFDTEETKSTGVLNRLVAEAAEPQADVFWSGDSVRPFVLVERGLVEPYLSPEAEQVPVGFRAADGTWTGTAARARVILVNRQRIGERPLPRSVRDLSDPRWKGEAAIANPLFGTTTMHVAAWASAWGEDETKRFLEALKFNEVRIASSNGEVKRLVISGEVTIGLTDTDDAFVALQSGAPVEVVYPDQDGFGTLIMPTAVVRMRGGPNSEAARRLIDFLLSAKAESMLAASGAHMPLRRDIERPGHVRGVGEIRAMEVDFAEIARQMERMQPWLRRWAGM
jgi:iron(III) transport system substrate-binding protein